MLTNCLPKLTLATLRSSIGGWSQGRDVWVWHTVCCGCPCASWGDPWVRHPSSYGVGLLMESMVQFSRIHVPLMHLEPKLLFSQLLTISQWCSSWLSTLEGGKEKWASIFWSVKCETTLTHLSIVKILSLPSVSSSVKCETTLPHHSIVKIFPLPSSFWSVKPENMLPIFPLTELGTYWATLV